MAERTRNPPVDGEPPLAAHWPVPEGAAPAAPSPVQICNREITGTPSPADPWTPRIHGSAFEARKQQNRALVRALHDAGLPKIAAVCADCCRLLDWHIYQHPEGYTYRVPVAVRTCKYRVCPLCQFLKSQRNLASLKALFAKSLELNPSMVVGHFVLTVPNVPPDKLPETLAAMHQGWRTMYRSKMFKKVIVGAFRATEITYNAQTGEYHPHIHVLVFLVGDHYFRRSSGLYVTNEQWVELWRACVGIPATEVVRTSTVQPRGSAQSPEAYADAIEEVIGYFVKPQSLFTPTENGFTCSPAVVSTLHTALHRLRQFSTVGIFNKARKAIKAENVAAFVDEHDLWDDELLPPFYAGTLLYRDAWLWNGQTYEQLDGEHCEPQPVIPEHVAFRFSRRRSVT